MLDPHDLKGRTSPDSNACRHPTRGIALVTTLDKIDDDQCVGQVKVTRFGLELRNCLKIWPASGPVPTSQSIRSITVDQIDHCHHPEARNQYVKDLSLEPHTFEPQARQVCKLSKSISKDAVARLASTLSSVRLWGVDSRVQSGAAAPWLTLIFCN